MLYYDARVYRLGRRYPGYEYGVRWVVAPGQMDLFGSSIGGGGSGGVSGVCEG